MLNQQAIAGTYGVSPLVAEILIKRGFQEMEALDEYLGYTVKSFDPMDVHGVPSAVDRIKWALDNNERILIYGDYDVDGITASAIMYQYLSQYNPDRQVIDFFVPDRMRDGYGLTLRGVKRLLDQGFEGLVITVDNGISAYDAVKEANSQGKFQVVVTDHHNIPGSQPLPETWVVNPRIGDQFPHMSGAGVAHLICCALEKQWPTEKGVDWLIDLVAIGTVADMCRLTGINRTLVRYGLELLNDGPRLGIYALLQEYGHDLDTEKITTETIGFKIGPCLNAAGRIENPTECVELMITGDGSRAQKISRWLIGVNEARRKVSSTGFDEADKIAESIMVQKPETGVLIVTSPDFHAGVVGLSAGNIVQKHEKPALLLVETEEGILKGSARSVDGFNILEALTSCSDLMINFGGHAAAAGMAFKKEHLPEIQRRLDEFALAIPKRVGPRRFPFDAEVGLGVVTSGLVQELELFEPCGMGNPAVHFLTSGLIITQQRLVGKKSKDHLSVKMSDGDKELAGIGFFMKELHPLPEDMQLTACYKPALNTFMGRQNVQMMLKDIFW